MTKPPRPTGQIPDLPDTAYAAPSDAVHVSPTGADGAAGTADAPLRSLERALRAAPEDGTIVVHDGTYRVGGLAVTKRLTVQPSPGAQVWLKGSRIVDRWQARGDRWCTQWDRSFAVPAHEKPDEYLDPEYPLASQRDMVFSDGEPLRQVGALSDVGPGSFAVDRRSHSLCVGSDPAGHTMEAAEHQSGMTVWGEKAAGTTIRGVGFAHYGDEGLRLGAARITLEKVTSVRNGISGVTLAGEGLADHTAVRSSNLSFNGRKGMGGGGKADDLLLENNLISYNNTEGFRTAWDAAGVKIINARKVVVRGNHFLGNYAHALWLDINVRDAQVTGNRFSANHQFGAFFEISQDALLAGNIGVNNGAGLAVANASDVDIVNNTLSGNVTNLLIKENAARVPQSWERAAQAPFVTRGLRVVNNLLIAPATDTTEQHLRVQRTPCKVEPRLIDLLDSNGYVEGEQTSVKLGTLQPAGDTCDGDAASSLEDLQKLAVEDNGMHVEGSTRDAVERKVVRDDFTLPADSPVRGRGIPLQGMEAQVMKVTPGRAVDLGAVQDAAPQRPDESPTNDSPAVPGQAAPAPQPQERPTDSDGASPGRNNSGGGGQGTDTADGDLASTGAQMWPAFAGLALLAVGALLLKARTRRRRPRHR
ncbi:right-handed parallel beta-helix repeat-containing protein [Streptomyces sp. NPDC056405]|uniref:right-handed parallel beta-helix repeat-containing protein n=1 Tax=Streptomyces sp. NPDC056405 TaxID=3345811 RepID=UPI0035E2A4F2